MVVGLITLFWLVITIGLFFIMRTLYTRFPIALFHPVLTSTTIIVLILIICNVSYTDYMQGGKWIDELLGACVVALAYPLYNQRKMMVQFKNAIMLGVSSGLLTAMGSVVLFAKLCKVESEMLYTLIPKSITTPVAIQLSERLAGIPSLTAVFVMIAGFSGVIIGPYVMKKTNIHLPIGIGMAFGSGAHGLGTAKSTEYGELALSAASVSMTLSAVLGALLGPILVLLL